MIRWWRRRSLRARLVLIGTFGLAAGFLAGGLVLFAVLGLTLQRTVDDAALSTARDVATLAAAGQLPDPVPVAGGQQTLVRRNAGWGGYSPDGRWLAYLSPVSGNDFAGGGLWIASVHGGTARALVRDVPLDHARAPHRGAAGRPRGADRAGG